MKPVLKVILRKLLNKYPENSGGSHELTLNIHLKVFELQMIYWKGYKITAESWFLS